jgi:hypothetical protein
MPSDRNEPPFDSGPHTGEAVRCQHCGADPEVELSATVSSVGGDPVGLGVLGAGCLAHVDDVFREMGAWLRGEGEGGARAFVRDEMARWS